jgi:heterodisulfide reductase subunit A
VHFIRGRVAEVTDWALDPTEEGKLVLRVEDTLAGIVRRIPVDMVVLSTGLEPQADAQEVRRLFNITCSSDGFFLERHPKLAPSIRSPTGFSCRVLSRPERHPGYGGRPAPPRWKPGAHRCRIPRNGAEPQHVAAEVCSGCQTCVPLPLRGRRFSGAGEDGTDQPGNVRRAAALCVAALSFNSIANTCLKTSRSTKIEGILAYA